MTGSGAQGSLEEIPLFPLGTVLLPGGRLPLRIFEPRYIEMVRRCADGGEFGVVLIREGFEARMTDEDVAPSICPFGTSARIVDITHAKDGTIGILGAGRRRFAVRETREQSDHLMLGKVQFLEPEPARPVEPEHALLLPVLERLSGHPLIRSLGAELDINDAVSVAWRLTDLLPIDPRVKQSILEMNTVTERLDKLLMLVGPGTASS